MEAELRSTHRKFALRNFTAFRDVELEFASGINVLVGENGTGKTHVLKSLYAVQNGSRGGLFGVREKLARVFQVDLNSLVRTTEDRSATATLEGLVGTTPWSYKFHQNTSIEGPVMDSREIGRQTFPDKAVFIPAYDMMAHTNGFLSLYAQREIDFDETAHDIVANLLLPLYRNLSTAQSEIISDLEKIIGGKLELEGERFYIAGKQDRFEIPVVAEGQRKIAALVRLIQVGALQHGSTLYWDEPEANLNPVLMEGLVRSLLLLSRSGIQVFLATHSYVILKELDLQIARDEAARFFAFKPDASGTQVSSVEDFSQLSPNAILDQYSSLYDRELSRATGRALKHAN